MKTTLHFLTEAVDEEEITVFITLLKTKNT